MLLLAVLVLGASWFMVSRLNAVGAVYTATDKNRNAAVVNLAKQTLIGYVALQASKQGEDNPGRLPCPEPPGNVGGANEGIAAGTCTLPAVGRLPWRTLGLDKLVDANSEPLWYVVSPGWAITAGNLVINSNTLGQLNVDGQANAAVALIIAPGAAMNVQASAGCTARSQTRATPSPTIDARDYIECFNTGTSAFSTTAPITSFNDQVVRITVADVMPAIEAAIAHRIERDIVPQLKSVYVSNIWAPTTSVANPLYPFAAPFANPTTSSYQGAPGLAAGLLPFNQMVGCTPAIDPRCTTTLIDWWSTSTSPTVYKASGYGYIQGSPTCTFQSAGTIADCQGEYHRDDSFTTGTMRIEMSVTLKNVAMGLRTIDTTALPSKMTVEARDDTCAPTCPWQSQTVTHTKTLNPDGSMSIIFGATLPNINVMGWGTYALFRVRFDRTGIFGDHALLDSADPTTGWFVRNEWYRLLYYAVASGFSPAGLTNYEPTYSSVSGLLPSGPPTTPSCANSASCIQVANVSPNWKQRAILILAGRSINGSARPSATLANYLEFGNATGGYERQPVSTAVAPALKKPFNDRVIVIDSN